jgi:RND family efflux transporter MFP subunit
METIERKPNAPATGGSARATQKSGRRRRQRIVVGVMALILVAGLGGMAWFGARNAHRGPANLQTAKVARLDIVETISATGSVTAQTGAMVKIGSDVTGRIKHLYADVGSHVESGQIIAELDVPEMVAQTRAAADNLELARQKLAEQGTSSVMQSRQNVNSVANAQESLRSAQIKRDEAAQLLSMQITQFDTDLSKARSALASAQASEAQAKSAYDMQVATARAAVRRSEAALKNSQAILKRKKDLLAKGYVSASDVDQATADEASAEAQVDSDRQNLSLAETNGQSTIKTTHEQTVQAGAALTATKAEQLQIAVKRQDLTASESSVRQATAQLDTAKAGLMQNDILRRQVAEARTSVAASTDQLNVDQSQLGKAFIRSPISGTVIELNAQQGETLVAGYSAAPVVTVADMNRLQVNAFVDETDIGKIKVGQAAKVTVDAFPDQPFDGVVSKVASGSTLQQNVVTYGVTVAIKDPHHLLKPDMTATVEITVSAHRNVLAVPDEAVKPQGMDSYVGIVPMGSTQPEKRKVVIGPSDGTHTEIVTGLKEGDTVVISGWTPVKNDRTGVMFGHD